MKNILMFLFVVLFVSSNVLSQSTERKATTKVKKSRQKSLTNSNNSIENKTTNDNTVKLEDLERKSKPSVERKTNGEINWTEQYIQAKGESVIDNERFKNSAQAKAMARRGAVVVAQRNLLEILNGVRVVGETTVQDMITKSDYVYTRVDGIIKGAEQVGEAIEKDGMMEVTMRVPIYAANGLAPAVYEEVQKDDAYKKLTNPAYLQPDNTAAAANQNQGEQLLTDDVLKKIAFDLNGKTYDASMFPVVVDENNNVLLDFSKFYNPKQGIFPKILQTTKDIFESAGYKKGMDIVQILEAQDGKLKINTKSNPKINWGKIAKTATTIGKYLLMLI